MALKCIANILLLESKTRQKFAEKGHAISVAKKISVLAAILSKMPC